jgi:DHA2 family methylenomycin A resistance protein-like MFS transporter
VLGGLLVTHAGWRSIFLINVPIGVAGIAVTLRYVAAPLPAHGRGIDVPGQLTAIAALVALTVGLTESARLGWHHPVVTGSLVLSVIATLAFLGIESRSQGPMLPLALFRTPALCVASAAGVIVNFAYYGLIFVFSLFFQMEQHLSAQSTMTMVLLGVNILAGRLLHRIGARTLMAAAMAVAASGYLLLLPVSANGSYWTLVVPMLIAASGIAVMVPTMTNVTLSSVDASRSGIASGILNSARQVGGMLGVAVFGYFVRDTRPAQFMHGMHVSILIAAGLLLCGGFMCLFGLRAAGSPAPAR